MSAAWRVLVGLLLGAGVGWWLSLSAPEAAGSLAAVLRPIGGLWLNALQMTIVPLVFSLLLLGIAQANDVAASGRIARRALLWMLILASAASLLAAFYAPAFLGLFDQNPELLQALQGGQAPPAPTGSLAQSLTALIPSNALNAAVQGAIVPLVVFALCFGVALTRLPAERSAPVLALARGVADAMLVVVHGVLWLAPLGVFALILPVIVEAGASVLGALGIYVLLLVSCYGMLLLALYVVATFAGGTPLRQFAAGILPAQVVAASTQSSLASLPAMLDVSANRLGHPSHIGSLVLPLAVSLFRICSPAQYLCVISFIGWAYGTPPDALTTAACVALAVLISMGSVGLPGQASFMGTNLPMVQAAGLPLEPLGLLLAVDLIPDAVATTGNVTGDLTVTARVAGSQSAAVAEFPGRGRDTPAS